MTLPLGNLGPPLDTPGYAEAPPLPSALFDAEHFRFLAEASTDGILVNRSGYYVYANPAAAALFKASGPEQLVGKRPFDLIHPDDHALVTARYASVLDGASMPLQEVRAVTSDGETIWVETTAACYYGTDGPSVLIIFRDITERKKTNALIRASEEKLRQALLASNTGLWEWDTQANEVQFSREWKSQLGYEDAELPDRFETWKERLHPDDQFRVLAYVQQYLAHPQGEYQQEFRLRHKEDSYRWIEARASFVTETDGRRVRLLGSHTD
ncbi:MAG: PAS domain-containing protein, partial [Nitrospira sp.]|nr:PAS domain-containing protein [Nitrospira sp.]